MPALYINSPQFFLYGQTIVIDDSRFVFFFFSVYCIIVWLATSVLYLFCCVLAIVCVYFFYLRRYVQERGRPINLSAAVCCQIKSEKLKIVIFLVSMLYPTNPQIFDCGQWARSLTLNVSFVILIFASRFFGCSRDVWIYLPIY